MMRRQLFLCTAIAALLSSPAQAQYVQRYQSSDKAQVEVNLDVLNDRQEQEYHAQTDVVQEPLPVSQPREMPAQAVEAMPETQPIVMQEVAVPAQKRKLLKPVLTAPAAEEETAPEITPPVAHPVLPSRVAAAHSPATPDGEMPMPPPVVKHSVIRSYSPVDDMPNMPSDAELYREADMEEMAGAISEPEKPLPLPRRKPEMGEKKPEPVKMAAMTAKVYKPSHSVVDDMPAVAAVATPEKSPEPKIEVAATEIEMDAQPEVKAEEKIEAKAEAVAEVPAEKEPVAETAAVEPAAEVTPEPTPEPVRMAAADIPAPVADAVTAPVAAPAPTRSRIISQPPVMKEQRLVPLEPRSPPSGKPVVSGKPIVSAPPSVGTAIAPAHATAPVAHTVPKMTAQPVAPVAAAPLPEIAAPLPEAVPVVPVEQAVAPVAPAPEATAATPRPPLEIIGAPMTDPNQPSEATEAMPVVPVIDDLTLGFPGNSSDLTGESQKKLDAVIHQMADMIEGRLQVRGYASGEDGSQSSARRIALSRALAVRSYLMDKGIKPTRVDVKAAGNDSDRQPLDRVDLIFAR